MKISEIANGLEMVASSTERLLAISAEMSLIVIIDFMPFDVFLMLFQLDSKVNSFYYVYTVVFNQYNV